MKTFRIKTQEQEIREYFFTISAKNREQAIEKVRSGEAESYGNQYVRGEFLDEELWVILEIKEL